MKYWSFVLLLILSTMIWACSSDDKEQTQADGDVELDQADGDSVDSSGEQDATETDGDIDDVELEAEPEIYDGPFKINKYFPPTTKVGGEISETFEALGGQEPYSNWRVILGDLPEGTVLNAETGAWTGSVSGEEGLAYFVVAVDDSTGETAKELFGIRIGDPATDGALAERAKGYQEVYEARHLWHGVSYSAKAPDDPNGDYKLSCCGDAAFASGQCNMAMAYRYSVEKSPEIFDVVREQVEGWRFFQGLTGVKGLIGRSFARADDPMEDGLYDTLYPDSDKYCYTEGEYAGWCWVADTSRDQVSGAVLGMTMAYDLLDEPELKQVAADFLVDLADHLWDNDLEFIDPDGEETTHGNIDGENFEGWPADNGLNALCALTWFKIAHHVSGEKRFDDYYRELIDEREYVRIMREHMWVYNMMGPYSNKWYNAYMAYENFFHLMRLEQDPDLRQEYHEIFRDTLWLNLEDETPNRKGIKEHNPVKTPWYLFSTGEHDPESLYYALWQINVFSEPPLRDRYIENSSDPTIEINPDKPTESLYPLPANKRKEDMVIWHRNPYDLDGGSDDGEERTGCDYMLPYWMGRYYGYVNPEW